MTSRKFTRTLLVLTASTLSMSALAEAPAASESGARHAGGYWLKQLDAEGKGYVTLEEYLAAGDAMFARLDADGDGRISAEELAAVRRDRHKGPRHEQHGERRHGRHDGHWFARMDADGDGYVSRAEFDDARLARFNALDANGNGVIDAGEFPARDGGRKGYGKRDRSRSK
jgi:hypothetical protein